MLSPRFLPPEALRGVHDKAEKGLSCPVLSSCLVSTCNKNRALHLPGIFLLLHAHRRFLSAVRPFNRSSLQQSPSSRLVPHTRLSSRDRTASFRMHVDSHLAGFAATASLPLSGLVPLLARSHLTSPTSCPIACLVTHLSPPLLSLSPCLSSQDGSHRCHEGQEGQGSGQVQGISQGPGHEGQEGCQVQRISRGQGYQGQVRRISTFPLC